MTTGLTSRVQTQSVPLLDIRAENEPLFAQLVEAVGSVMASGRYVLGDSCEALERAIAERCGCRFGIGCASGSEALLLSLMERGIGPGDEVIVPSFTFFATASCIWRLGATPIFADIVPHTFNIDPEHVTELITERTKAVIPVHLFGQCADIPAIKQLTDNHGLFLIEDAAQAIGASASGRVAGSTGDVSCISFYPTKNLGCVGDGGMLTTNDEEIANRLRLLRGHGMQPRYYHKEVGINSRLDEIQAAMLLVKLPHLEAWTAQRQANAERYASLFGGAGLGEFICLPPVEVQAVHVWNQYTIRVLNGRRDELRAHLQQRDIGTEIYYPVPIHRQACFADLDSVHVQLPETDKAADEVLSLPISPALSSEQQAYVVDQIQEFFSSS